MKKTQLIIALTSIFITVTPTNLYADACTTLGATTGTTCYSGNISNKVPMGVNCTSASSGCTYKVCNNNCTCIDTACPSPTTNCTSVTCNPIWGSIDTSTHIQTGTAREPDTSNNCVCKNRTINSTIYRCISGYYDSRTGTTLIGSKPSCTICPSLGKNNVAGQSNTGITDSPTNKGVASCYIPYNTDIKDDTGTYIFYKSGILTSGGCNYSDPLTIPIL